MLSRGAGAFAGILQATRTGYKGESHNRASTQSLWSPLLSQDGYYLSVTPYIVYSCNTRVSQDIETVHALHGLLDESGSAREVRAARTVQTMYFPASSKPSDTRTTGPDKRRRRVTEWPAGQATTGGIGPAPLGVRRPIKNTTEVFLMFSMSPVADMAPAWRRDPTHVRG